MRECSDLVHTQIHGLLFNCVVSYVPRLTIISTLLLLFFFRIHRILGPVVGTFVYVRIICDLKGGENRENDRLFRCKLKSRFFVVVFVYIFFSLTGIALEANRLSNHLLVKIICVCVVLNFYVRAFG